MTVKPRTEKTCHFSTSTSSDGHKRTLDLIRDSVDLRTIKQCHPVSKTGTARQRSNTWNKQHDLSVESHEVNTVKYIVLCSKPKGMFLKKKGQTKIYKTTIVRGFHFIHMNFFLEGFLFFFSALTSFQ